MEIWGRSQFQTKLAVELTVEMHGEDSMMIPQLPHLTVKGLDMNHLFPHIESCPSLWWLLVIYADKNPLQRVLIRQQVSVGKDISNLVPTTTILFPLVRTQALSILSAIRR